MPTCMAAMTVVTISERADVLRESIAARKNTNVIFTISENWIVMPWNERDSFAPPEVAEADREANIAAAVAGAREEARLMVEEASRAADAASDKRREDNTLSIAVMKARAKEKRPQAVRYILENLAES